MASQPTPGEDAESDHEHEDAHHRSRWPLVSSIGAGTLYIGFALAVVGEAAGVLPLAAAVPIALAGVLVTAVGLFGWLQEAYLSGYWQRTETPRDRRIYVTTMYLFLGTDVSTFAAGFVYYAFVRVGTWPPGELPPLLGSLVLANTAILVASSVVLHVAHGALERGNRRRFLALLALTVAMGAVFLAGQAYEYYEFIVHEGFTVTSGVYASAFYGLTGLHGFHVALGVALLTIVLWRALSGQYGPERDASVATVALYWHFVDVVWLVLVAALYVGAVVTV